MFSSTIFTALQRIDFLALEGRKQFFIFVLNLSVLNELSWIVTLTSAEVFII